MSTITTAEQIVDGFLQQGVAIGKLINSADANGRTHRFEMTAKVVAFAGQALADADVLNAAFAKAKLRDIHVPDYQNGANIFMMFLMLLRAEKNVNGKWELPTRGDERYAKVARFLTFVGVAEADVVRVLLNHEDIGDGHKNGGTIRATVAAIEAADQVFFGEARKIKPLDSKAKTKATGVTAVGEVTLPSWAVGQFKASEGFGLLVYELRGNKLRILCDSGKEGREVFGVVESRIEEYATVAPKKASAASSVLKEVQASLTPKARSKVEA